MFTHPGLISQGLRVCTYPPTYLVNCLVSFNGSKGLPRLLINTKSPSISITPSLFFWLNDRAILLWYLSGSSNVGLARPVVRLSWLNTRSIELQYRRFAHLHPSPGSFSVVFLLWTFGRDTFHKQQHCFIFHAFFHSSFLTTLMLFHEPPCSIHPFLLN